MLRNGWQVRTGEDAARTVSWLLRGGHRAEYEKAGLGTAKSFAGWDAQRVANVAGWAYAAYLVDLETAWAWHRQAGALVRESFTSWAEFGASYLAGLATWSEGDRQVLDPSEQAMAWLLGDPTSPWLTLPFDLELGSTAAIRRAVGLSLGVAFLSRWSMGEDLDAGRLRLLHIPGLAIERRFSWALPSAPLGGTAARFHTFASAEHEVMRP